MLKVFKGHDAENTVLFIVFVTLMANTSVLINEDHRDLDSVDSYSFDIDPDVHFYSTLNASTFNDTNFCKYYSVENLNESLVNMHSDSFSTFSSEHTKFI